ncbi:N-acetyltransferase [Rathayibacter tritici]|uniref:GNAT family N-acetyltransferase n=1 Tax=Rathayibacter tritici TaxID=33888 RepID=UPI000CE74225|nr:GNAT family N-acetyltransferase [Rathayibacter tritici]PPF28057.1 N-acetyltransferase [Rathayibacter tritici]PPF62583.1 N-acetyltransferase [Rathayibacter tritici]PPG03762.1 N-acetyltransferase [Rathayibacter tritici]PPI10701.1 N-acetyltransferase [Rathayibacter tritici]
MTPEDWAAVETIYRDGIATGHATFEAEPPTWEAFDAGKLDVGRLVAVDREQILGWAALSKVSARPVYRGVVEHSVYIAAAARGRGVGSTLLAALITAADDADLWMMQASIFPENIVSLALHDRAGFRRVGIRERIARMTYGPEAGRWRDTILIERRRP